MKTCPVNERRTCRVGMSRQDRECVGVGSTEEDRALRGPQTIGKSAAMSSEKRRMRIESRRTEPRRRGAAMTGRIREWTPQGGGGSRGKSARSTGLTRLACTSQTRAAKNRADQRDATLNGHLITYSGRIRTGVRGPEARRAHWCSGRGAAGSGR